MSFDFVYNFVWNIFHSKSEMWSKTSSGLHVNYPVFDFSRQIFEKYSNIRFHENRPVGAELFHAGRWTDGRVDTTKLMVVFGNFENEPKN